MAGHRHDLKEIIPGQAKIVDCTVTKVVEGEVFYPCVAASRLKAAFDRIEGFTIPEKDSLGMKRPGDFLQSRP